MSWYRQQLEDWLKTLDVKADTVLDIGGKQGPVKGRTKSWDVKDYTILDLPEYDLEDTMLVFKTEKRAEVIFCLEVFEYLIDPFTALNNIWVLLKEGGKTYISIPLVYPVHNEVELDSLRYTENGFKRICEAAGLKAEVVEYRKTCSDKLTNYYADDGMHPAKGIDHEVTGYIFKVVR